MVKHNHKWLAVIEATQSGEVIFTLLGGILFLKDPVPSAIGLAGIAIIVAGMTETVYASKQKVTLLKTGQLFAHF